MFVLNPKKQQIRNNILAKRALILKNLQHIGKIKNDNSDNSDNIYNQEYESDFDYELDPNESVPNESVPDESVPDESVPDELYTNELELDKSEPNESVPDELYTKELELDDSELDDSEQYEYKDFIKKEVENDIVFIENYKNTENRLIIYKSLYNSVNTHFNVNDNDNFKNYYVNNDIKNYLKNDTNFYNHNIMKIEDGNINKQPMNYEEKMNNIQKLINRIINNSDTQEPYIFKKFIADSSQNSSLYEKPIKKKLLNFNKINRVINDENNSLNITHNTLHNKFNNIVKKINDKIHNEIGKDLFTFGDILTNKESKESIFNMICLTVLNKIEKIVN
jgi:hypothetical protein